MDKVRERTPQYWTDPKTTITQLEAVGRIYAAVSTFGYVWDDIPLTLSIPCRPDSLRVSSHRTCLPQRRRRRRRRRRRLEGAEYAPLACIYPTFLLSQVVVCPVPFYVCLS